VALIARAVFSLRSSRHAAWNWTAHRASVGEAGMDEGDDVRAVARRRLKLLGASALADDELLTLVVPRLQGKTARARGLGLKGLAQLDLDGLIAELELRPADAGALLAAVELGRRCLSATEARPRLSTPHDIHRYVLHSFSALRCEEFRVLCFNARSVLVKEACVARGSTSHCQVDPREVFAPAVAARASAVVLVHNHPSGDPEPSQLDVTLTLQLRDAGRSLCIRVLDHLVVGDGGFVSLAQRGLFRDDLSGPLVAPRVHQR
jgi:DNA repair protein RadC